MPRRTPIWLRHPILVGIIVWVTLNVLLGHFVPPSVCRDGWHSPSIGHRGACSHHGGVAPNGWGELVFLFSVICSVTVGVLIASRRDAFTRAQYEALPAPPGLPSIGIARSAEPPAPTCPRCAASMRKRVARKGRFQGQAFWGCSRYPRCKGTRSLGCDPLTMPAPGIDDTTMRP